MANTITTQNMGLTLPVPGIETGPNYALDLNNSLTRVDGHDHTTGNGVPITPNAINITTDLPFNDHNLAHVRSVRLDEQSRVFNPVINDPNDVGSVYRVGTDLWWSNGSGTQVQITVGSSLAGTSGSISGMTGGASVNFSGGTYTFKSTATLPANLDAESIVLRNNAALSKGLTLSPPNAMASDYSITLPPYPYPIGPQIMTLDGSGNMTAPYTIDTNTMAIVSNVIKVKDQGISATQIANNTITTTQISNTANITATQIANNTITTSQISNSANITGTQIAPGTVAPSNRTTSTTQVPSGLTITTPGTTTINFTANGSQPSLVILTISLSYTNSSGSSQFAAFITSPSFITNSACVWREDIASTGNVNTRQLTIAGYVPAGVSSVVLTTTTCNFWSGIPSLTVIGL